MIFVDYIVVNNTRLHILMKTKIHDFEPKVVEDVPPWDISAFDTYEDIDPRPEMTLQPVALFRCPFRKGKNKIVLCEFINKDKVPEVNTRRPFAEFLQRHEIEQEEPWVGFEQEYWVTDRDGVPLGWQMDKDFVHNKRYLGLAKGKYSGLERQLGDYHARACLYAGLHLFGTSIEESVGQWEYMLGPVDCLTVCDELVASRYLMWRCAEIFGIHVSILTKPAPFTVWASGVHINYSTKKMKAEGGIEHIKATIKKLEEISLQCLLVHFDRNAGKDNENRLIGDCYMPSCKEFTWGVEDKFACVRIPLRMGQDGKGYLEERRPAADCDPYAACLAFMKAIHTDELL